MTEIKLTLEDPPELARWLHAHAGQMPATWQARADQLDAIAYQIEEQVKPAIEEPTEFGSMVRARSDKLFVLADVTGDDDMRWCGQNGLWCRFANLDVVEVVRVGIGEPSVEDEAAASYAATVAQGEAYSRGYEEGVQSNLPSPVDRSNILSAIQDELAQTAGGLTAAVMKALS